MTPTEVDRLCALLERLNNEISGIKVTLDRSINALEFLGMGIKDMVQSHQKGEDDTPQDIPPIVPPSAVLTKEESAVLAFLKWSKTGFRLPNGQIVNIDTVQRYHLSEIWSQMTEKQRYRAMKELGA